MGKNGIKNTELDPCIYADKVNDQGSILNGERSVYSINEVK